MVLKKKVTAAVLAGVLATAAVVPMGLTASAAKSGDVQVQYIAGALVPDDGDGSYYITIPSNVLFSGQGDKADMTVQLHRTDVTKTLDANLGITVDVYSANDYALKNKSFASTTGTYELKYAADANTTVADGDWQTLTALANTATAADPADPQPDEGDEVGLLTVDSNLNNTTSNANKSLVGSIQGRAQMTAEPTVDTQGVSFTDTLTYFVTQTTSTQP